MIVPVLKTVMLSLTEALKPLKYPRTTACGISLESTCPQTGSGLKSTDTKFNISTVKKGQGGFLLLVEFL